MRTTSTFLLFHCDQLRSISLVVFTASRVAVWPVGSPSALTVKDSVEPVPFAAMFAQVVLLAVYQKFEL